MKISVSINVTKIQKEHLYEGKSGKYLDVTLIENKDGKDQYGNDGFVAQKASKAAYERGEKGPIIGNWKRIETATQYKPFAPSPNEAPKPEKYDPELGF